MQGYGKFAKMMVNKIYGEEGADGQGGAGEPAQGSAAGEEADADRGGRQFHYAEHAEPDRERDGNTVDQDADVFGGGAGPAGRAADRGGGAGRPGAAAGGQAGAPRGGIRKGAGKSRAASGRAF